MNHHSSTIKRYYPAVIGAALIAASLSQFSLPVLSAGTQAGQKIRNTATGSYKDDAPTPNTYTIDSNTVEVTVAKVAGITNMPTGITDKTVSTTNTSVLTGDDVAFEFTITNVGNDISNIYIPGTAANMATKGLDPATMVVEVSQVNPGNNPTFVAYSTLTNGIVPDVPINGKIIVRVTAKVTATAAGAPVEVRLGDTGSNTDPNTPVADTQNQFDHGTTAGGFTDVAIAANEVRTLNATTPTAGVTALTAVQQKEASAVQRVSLGSNPMAMAKIEKTRGTVLNGLLPNDLRDNIVPYSLQLEVQSNTPNAQYIPGKLKGRNFGTRVTGVADTSDLILVSDAIPANTVLQGVPTGSPADWTPVYAIGAEPAYDSTKNLAADQLQWTTTIPADKTTITRVGWVYDARATGGKGPLDPGTTVTGFAFNVVTTGLDALTGGSVANIGQVFGGTVSGPNIFDESGDQDPSNFSGPNPGPSETATGSTGIADPADHTVDSDNNNNATNSDPASPGGEDNVITIGAPGTLLNGPDGKPTATGKIFDKGPDNNHDFQNKGISNFSSATCTPTSVSGNPQSGQGCKLDPNAVEFTNTLSNPSSDDLTDVLLQPIHPSFDGFGGTDARIPNGTKVTINLGGQQAIYTYTLTGTGATATGSFALDANTPTAPSQPIKIPVLKGGVPLDYKVTVDLPPNTELSTDLEYGFAVPIIAFIDGDNDGTPDSLEKSNYTVNQVYTGFIKVTKQVKVVRDTDGDGIFEDNEVVSGMDYANNNADKKPLPGDALVYRVNYRNISEPQTGNGSNLVLNGKNVMIDENGTQAKITGMETKGNNWGLDNNIPADGDIDTINVQGSAKDSNSNSTITYYTGTSPATATSKYSVDSLTSAGTTDPGDTVTGYRSTIPTLAPSATDSTFEFQRKVDQYDGLAQEGLN
jgi:hypothetical protein